MIRFWIQSDRIRDKVYIPKYYDPEITERLQQLSRTHDCIPFSDLIERGVMSSATGDEIGKAAYGTGDIPFVRTSDITNWEIKAAPKQGVSREIYDTYASGQDVQVGDVLLVRDGTYLIGANCPVTRFDKQILYQSHLLKLRVADPQALDPYLLFLALNCQVVQRQMRSFQFTADIIDTIGRRFFDTVIPIPKAPQIRASLSTRTSTALNTRMKSKAFIQMCPVLIEEALRIASDEPLVRFFSATDDEIIDALRPETVSSEFGDFAHFWLSSSDMRDLILIPKYYDPSLQRELTALSDTCELRSFGELRDAKVLSYGTGDEIGKMAYGTGAIPFIRTSDFGNWEIKHDPKHMISQAIYEEYATKEDVQENDIFLVRDGTYLVGTSCIVTKEDERCLFCGGLFKIRTLQPMELDPFMLLGLMNSYIVKRQFRTKQFTRDVIDTLGNRIDEVVLPIPKSPALRAAIGDAVRGVIESRIGARNDIRRLAREYEGMDMAALLRDAQEAV